MARRFRFTILLIRELARKYTSALVVGFFIGLIGTVGVYRVIPWIIQTVFTPTDRIGIVGDFSPTSLPLDIQKKISMGLTDISSDGTPIPGLARTWTIDDGGKTYIFSLRDDVVWHTGKSVLADDVNYNIKDVSFIVMDPHTIRVTLKDKFAPFPSIVSKPLFQPGLVGMGSFRVDSVKLKGDSLIYLKLLPIDNQKRKPIEYRFYKTQSQAILAYQLGDIDSISDLSDPGPLQTWGNATISEFTSYDRIIGVYFNLSDEKLSNRQFRQALSYLIPDLPGERADSPIPKNSWAYVKDTHIYEYDPKAAKKLLVSKDASSSATLTISTFPAYAGIADSIAHSWTESGIPTIVKIENDISSGFQILISAQYLPVDPDQYPLWHSTQKDTNITGYVNVKIDKLLEDARKELDIDKRKKLYADFAKRLTDDVPVIFLTYPKLYTVTRKKQ